MEQRGYWLTEETLKKLHRVINKPDGCYGVGNAPTETSEGDQDISFVKYTGSNQGKITQFYSSDNAWHEFATVNVLHPNNIDALITDEKYLAVCVGQDGSKVLNYMIIAIEKTSMVQVTANYDSSYWVGQRVEFVTAGSWSSPGNVMLREANGRQLFIDRVYLAIETTEITNDLPIWLCVANPIEIIECGTASGDYYNGKLCAYTPPTSFTYEGGSLGDVKLRSADGKALVPGNHYLGVFESFYDSTHPLYWTESGENGISLTMPTQFSVSGSPAVDGGTLAISWQNESANTVLAGPSSGSPAAPTFRALVAADVSGLSGSGTVTSVAQTAPSEITVSGSPVTTSGTLALSWTNQTAGKVFASPSDSTGTPAFRAIVNADLPGSLSGGNNGDMISGLLIGGNPGWTTFASPGAAGYYLSCDTNLGGGVFVPGWRFLDGSKVNLLAGQLNNDWGGAGKPTTLNEGLNRMSTALVGLLGGPIP